MTRPLLTFLLVPLVACGSVPDPEEEGALPIVHVVQRFDGYELLATSVSVEGAEAFGSPIEVYGPLFNAVGADSEAGTAIRRHLDDLPVDALVALHLEDAPFEVAILVVDALLERPEPERARARARLAEALGRPEAPLCALLETCVEPSVEGPIVLTAL